MKETRQKLCFVLPEYSRNTSSRFYHVWELLEELTRSLRIYLFVEHATDYPSLKGADHVYVQRFTGFPLRLLERLIVFLRIRLLGYRHFYIDLSYSSSLLAIMISRVFGGQVYYWNCGLRGVAEPRQRTLRQKMVKKLLDEYTFGFNLKMVNSFATCTPLMASFYSQKFGINLKKIKIIPNSINLDRFKPGDYDPVALRKKLAIREGSKVVLFVHFLSERRGAHYLPEIIGEVTAKIPEATFVIVGDGPYRDKLKHEIHEAGLDNCTKLMGNVPNVEVTGYYALADLFIMPSDAEAFPCVLLEAMAMGVPFVATNIGGVKDVLTRRQLEFTTQVGDVVGFYRKIIHILNNDELREELSKEGFTKVKEFDKGVVAKQLADTIFASNT